MIQEGSSFHLIMTLFHLGIVLLSILDVNWIPYHDIRFGLHWCICMTEEVNYFVVAQEEIGNLDRHNHYVSSIPPCTTSIINKS